MDPGKFLMDGRNFPVSCSASVPLRARAGVFGGGGSPFVRNILLPYILIILYCRFAAGGGTDQARDVDDDAL